jgi:copper/silver efflux system protein
MLQVGSAETPTDSGPIKMIAPVVSLKPRSAWHPGIVLEMLIYELDLAPTSTGVSSIFCIPSNRSGLGVLSDEYLARIHSVPR